MISEAELNRLMEDNMKDFDVNHVIECQLHMKMKISHLSLALQFDMLPDDKEAFDKFFDKIRIQILSLVAANEKLLETNPQLQEQAKEMQQLHNEQTDMLKMAKKRMGV